MSKAHGAWCMAHGAWRIGHGAMVPLVAFFALLPFVASCNRRDNAPARPSAVAQAPVRIDVSSFSGERALEEVRRFVEIRPRNSGSDGARRAAEYLVAELKKRGLDPKVDEFHADNTAGIQAFRNVTAVVGPVDRGMVVLVSHYDTKSGITGDFQGANDSGSSTGLLLELATVLTNSPGLPCGVLLAFLDGEECALAYGAKDGLHGSRRLAETMVRDGLAKQVKAVIVVDMIGDRDLTVALPRNSTGPLAAEVFKAAAEEGVRSKFVLAEGDVLDDHVPFIAAGMPAVDIIDFSYGSAPGANDYWHTAQDSVDKLSPESLSVIGRIVIRLIQKHVN